MDKEMYEALLKALANDAVMLGYYKRLVEVGGDDELAKAQAQEWTRYYKNRIDVQIKELMDMV